MITANELRNGKAFELDGELFVVTSFQHIKPGKGSPFVRIKMRGIKSNSTIERTFRPDEKIQDAYLENKVNSELPADWRPGEVKMSGLQTNDEATLPHTGGFQRSLLFVMVTVTILMVVAWFNVLPFSGYILKPFYLMIKALEKLVSMFV